MLFVREDSIYKTFSCCDAWDIERDALRFKGKQPIIAHPPCRAWGSLSYFAKPREGERELAIWVVGKIRENGGVLEHPERSKLWPEMKLPNSGERDGFGGWTLKLPQFWFGHKANKATRLYIVGCEPKDVPEIPLKLGEATHVVCTYRKQKRRPEISKEARERTPVDFAKWLIELAQRCKK